MRTLLRVALGLVLAPFGALGGNSLGSIVVTLASLPLALETAIHVALVALGFVAGFAVALPPRNKSKSD